MRGQAAAASSSEELDIAGRVPYQPTLEVLTRDHTDSEALRAGMPEAVRLLDAMVRALFQLQRWQRCRRNPREILYLDLNELVTDHARDKCRLSKSGSRAPTGLHCGNTHSRK